MKLSCLIDLVPGNNLLQQTHFLSTAGFDAFEIFLTLTNLKNKKKELKEIMKREEICISAIGPIHNGWLIDPDKIQRQTARREISEAIEIAGDLGFSQVIILPILGYSRALPNSKTTLRTKQEDTEILINELGFLADKSQKTGSTLLLELINRYESPVANLISEGVKILKIINNDRCRLALDLFHMNFEESYLQSTIVDAFPYIGHVHIADSNRRIPGLGHINIKPLISILVKLGYDRFLTLEVKEDKSITSTTLTLFVNYLRGLIQILKIGDCNPLNS